jgi:hypothetical protein
MSERKSVPLKSTAPVVKSAPLPSAKAKRDWADFDDFARAGESLNQRISQIMETIEKLLQKDPSSLAGAELVAQYGPDPVALAREFQRGWAIYERDELYEETKKARPDLLDCWTTRVIKRRVVSEMISLLVGSFANANPGSGEVFMKMLVEEVRAANPGASVLEATCREIRRTHTFVPVIAEVLKILRKQAEHWEGFVELDEDCARACINDLAKAIREARARLPGPGCHA